MERFLKWIVLIISSCLLSSRSFVLADGCPYYRDEDRRVDQLQLNYNNLPIIYSGSFGNCNYTAITITNSNVSIVSSKAFLKYNLLKLDMRKNYIEDIEFCSKLVTLEHINLWNNMIREISAIKNLKNLKYLDVGHNLIETLTPSLFENLVQLEILRLQWNKFTNLPDKLFDGLSKLRKLDLEGNRLHSIASTAFAGANNLEALEIAQRNLVNVLPTLNALETLIVNSHNESIVGDTFSGLSSISQLTLRNGNIFSVQNYPFEDMAKLEKIIFKLVTVKELCLKSFLKAPAILYVGSSENRPLNNKILNLDFSSISVEVLLPDISEVENLKMLNINLNHNNIKKLSANIFYNIFNIDVLRLDNNLIDSIDEKAFEHMSFKKCVYHYDDYFDEYSHPKKGCNNELYLNRNLLKKIQKNSFKTIKNIFKIYLNDNLIKEIEPLAFNGLSMHENYINLETNETVSSPAQICLTNNSISKILNDSFAGVINLKTLFLNRNQIFLIEEKGLAHLTNLTTLDLSNNKLIYIEGKIFASLNNLQSLDLSANFIKYLSSESLFGLTALNVLNVSLNQLSTFDWTIMYPLRNLDTLDLSNNRLENLDYVSLKMHMPDLKTLGISGNQWECTLLISMLRFFRLENIKYYLNNQTLEYNRKNVEGFYCNNETELLSKTSRTVQYCSGRFLTREANSKIYRIQSAATKTTPKGQLLAFLVTPECR